VRDWRKQIADSKARFLSDTDEHVMTVFDLVTWPGYLSITGDMGAYTFARVQDMFTFFYGSSINPGYWGEKVVAGEVRAYSEDTFREWVEDEVRSAKEEKPELGWKRIDSYLETEVIDEGSYVDGAHSAIYDWNSGHGLAFGFTFYTDEGLDFTDFTHRFLWCCHAIQWGIEQYNAAKAVSVDS
jgi:hypothetical protein